MAKILEKIPAQEIEKTLKVMNFAAEAARRRFVRLEAALKRKYRDDALPAAGCFYNCFQLEIMKNTMKLMIAAGKTKMEAEADFADMLENIRQEAVRLL